MVAGLAYVAAGVGLWLERRSLPKLLPEGLAVALGVEREVVLAASVPFTAEAGWRALAEGEIIVAQEGRIVSGTRGTEGAAP